MNQSHYSIRAFLSNASAYRAVTVTVRAVSSFTYVMNEFFTANHPLKYQVVH